MSPRESIDFEEPTQRDLVKNNENTFLDTQTNIWSYSEPLNLF
jgi:hypothetical protein